MVTSPDLTPYVPYRLSNLEQVHRYEVPVDMLRMSMVDFVDLERFKPGISEFAAAEDEALLKSPERVPQPSLRDSAGKGNHTGGIAVETSKKSEHSMAPMPTVASSTTKEGGTTSRPYRTEVSWLRRTEYLAADYARGRSSKVTNSTATTTAQSTATMTTAKLESKQDVLLAIERSFAHEPRLEELRHPTNPNLRATRMLQVLPDMEVETYAQCTFDADPHAEMVEGTAIRSEGDAYALIKAMSNANDPNDTFVWYYLPTDVGTQRFLYTRDYDIQRVDRQGQAYYILSMPMPKKQEEEENHQHQGHSQDLPQKAALFTPITSHFGLKKRRTRADQWRRRHFLTLTHL